MKDQRSVGMSEAQSRTWRDQKSGWTSGIANLEEASSSAQRKNCSSPYRVQLLQSALALRLQLCRRALLHFAIEKNERMSRVKFNYVLPTAKRVEPELRGFHKILIYKDIFF